MKFLEYISYTIIPIMIGYIILSAFIRKIKVYDCFIEGVLKGTKTILKIFPNIFAIIIAITVFRSSGALDLIIKIVEPITNFFKIPKEIIPLGFMSSVSRRSFTWFTCRHIKTIRHRYNNRKNGVNNFR